MYINSAGTHHSHDHNMAVGFTTTYLCNLPITTKVVSLNPTHG